MIMFLLKPKLLTPFKMGILPKGPENQVNVLIPEHPATVKTLKHLFLLPQKPQCIDKHCSLTVSTAAQNPISIKEPIPQARQVRQGQPLFSSANLLCPIYPVFFLSSAFFLIKDSQSKPSERFATPNNSDQYYDDGDDQ